MNTAYYKIAGLTICLEGNAPELKELDGFAPFRTEEVDNVIATIHLHSTMEEFDFDSAEWIFTSGVGGVGYQFGRHAGGFCYRSNYNTESLKMWYESDKREIWCNAERTTTYQPYELRFMLWVAYSLAALPYNAVAVHTSVIMNGGKAYMFLGESGTGKSTHTRLWRQHIEGSELLNDDSPILRIEGDEAVVYGSPWSGKTPCYKPLRLPLGGITRLSQAPYNKMRRLGTLEAMGALLPSCPPNFAYDDSLTDGMCAIISSVIATVPVFHLECLPDKQAAKLSFAKLTGNDK
ncbi:MAG: hypothetical protein IKA60_02970 [Rikenellaceae bacterium]|nr:hypothetical protein [Rikenellaceae bacterium]